MNADFGLMSNSKDLFGTCCFGTNNFRIRRLAFRVGVLRLKTTCS